MNKLYYLLLSIILMFTTTSCCDDDAYSPPSPPSPPTPSLVNAEKTIFMYLPWTASKTSLSGSLRSFFLDNISDIEKGIVSDGGLKNNRLLIFMVDSVTPTKEKAILMEVKYKSGQCYRDTLEIFTAANMPVYTSADGLANVLLKVKNTAPAQQYGMLIGCHGLGWLRSSEPNRMRTRYFGGMTKAFQMDTPDLAEAISKAGMKMQYIMFDDCYMSTIEVAYDLRKVTTHLMACTSEIMGYGMPYSKMWSALAKPEPDYQAINDAFFNFYSSYSYPYGTFGITDCTHIDEMAAVMKKINAAHSFNITDTVHVQKLDGFRNTIFYDMDSYVKQLCANTNLYNEFSAVLAKMVPYKSVTPSIYTDYRELPSPYIPVTHFSGITISDPTVSGYHSASTSKMTTDWWKVTH